MSAIGNGGPAFPVVVTFVKPGFVIASYDQIAAGMSLRDYFAAQAMTGWLADGAVSRIRAMPEATDASALQTMARSCYQFADAMLVARQR